MDPTAAPGGAFHLDYTSVTGIDGDIVYEDVPVYIDHDAEEICIGIDVPYDGDGHETTLDTHWRETDTSYLPALSDIDDPETELYRRLPELAALDDERNDRLATIAIEVIPDAFWRYPSSTGGNYHPEDERGVHGQWIHQKRVLANFLHNIRSRLNMGLPAQGIAERTVQNGIEAAVYQDMFKFGTGPEPSYHTEPGHATTAAQYLREQEQYDFEPAIVWAVERHNGPKDWDGAPEPYMPLEHMIHTADMTAAASQNASLLVEPTEELIYADILTRLRGRNEAYDWGLEDYTIRPDTDAMLRKL